MSTICDQSTGQRYNTVSIKSYEIIDSKKSGASTIMRAGIGAAFLGPVGLLAGATAKKTYSVLIIFDDGYSTLMKINETDLKTLVSNVRSWI